MTAHLVKKNCANLNHKSSKPTEIEHDRNLDTSTPCQGDILPGSRGLVLPNLVAFYDQTKSVGSLSSTLCKKINAYIPINKERRQRSSDAR